MPTLNWIGKEAVINHHRQVPYHLLRCDNSLSCGDADSGNLLVEGDNLLALKALLPYYAGQVKCIYIDPPYNIGNEKNWRYNDNVNSPEIRKWLGKVVGAEAEDLSRHDKWLCMMYPRLSLLKDFMREDGVIFVSIDDIEVGNLRILMDEIFGRQNFLSNIIWQKKYTRANDAKYFSDNHDHILSYAKNKIKFSIGRLERTEKQNKAYKNPDNHSLGPWKPTPLHAKSGSDRSTYTFKNGIVWEPPKGTYRRYNDVTMARLDENDEIWFGKHGNATPQRKTFLGSLSVGLVPVTIWLHEVVGDNHIARDEIKGILSGSDSLFDNPKPTTLLKTILQLATDKDSIILDSFAGSGTTGHAVLGLNKRDGGKRRFIMVEMERDICQSVTGERMRCVVMGYTRINGDKKIEVGGLGSGFRYCRLDKPLFDETGKISESVKFADLAAHVFFTETGGPIPKRANGANPFLGTANGTGYYLLFNGILGDKTPDGGNVLTGKVLASLPKHNGPKVIFGEGCRLGDARLRREQITFKQLPYEIKVS